MYISVKKHSNYKYTPINIKFKNDLSSSLSQNLFLHLFNKYFLSPLLCAN